MITGSRQGFITGGTRTIDELSATLQSFVERPVIDETGLTGTFNVDVAMSASLPRRHVPTLA